jgi:phosphoglucomutase
MSKHTIEIRPTKPFTDQKPGTSGLRKPTKTFKENQYFENFIQAYFDDLTETNKDKLPTLVVGGDGRHFVREGTRIIIQMAAANNVKIPNFIFRKKFFFRLKNYLLHEMD